MNIAKHMEAIFACAVIVACAMVYASTTAPVITVNVSAPSVPHLVVAPAIGQGAHRA